MWKRSAATAPEVGNDFESDLKKTKQRLFSSQGKTPWVGQSCADCPGFPVLDAGDAPPPELHLEALECAPGLAFAFMALRANSWICCPELPYHPSKNGTRSTWFCSTRGHTPILPQERDPKVTETCLGVTFWSFPWLSFQGAKNILRRLRGQ